MTDRCIFCALGRESAVWESPLVFAVRDTYPVSEGHTLLILRRHAVNWFDASREEKLALLDGLDVMCRRLSEDLRPDGFNIGTNVGEAAGQTILHLHIHLIPRYQGDVPNPRGGVRYVIPERGYYDDMQGH